MGWRNVNFSIAEVREPQLANKGLPPSGIGEPDEDRSQPLTLGSPGMISQRERPVRLKGCRGSVREQRIAGKRFLKIGDDALQVHFVTLCGTHGDTHLLGDAGDAALTVFDVTVHLELAFG